mmetsp:Transcript_11097/g.29126  ORF Transcript_11097/g.29126 Transcript_11097/m.29126 type:complete len:269 (-) Transcript_11097:1003-1809(-)
MTTSTLLLCLSFLFALPPPSFSSVLLSVTAGRPPNDLDPPIADIPIRLDFFEGDPTAPPSDTSTEGLPEGELALPAPFPFTPTLVFITGSDAFFTRGEGRGRIAPRVPPGPPSLSLSLSLEGAGAWPPPRRSTDVPARRGRGRGIGDGDNSGMGEGTFDRPSTVPPVPPLAGLAGEFFMLGSATNLIDFTSAAVMIEGLIVDSRWDLPACSSVTSELYVSSMASDEFALFLPGFALPLLCLDEGRAYTFSTLAGPFGVVLPGLNRAGS